VARVLIVGCGCRGQSLARALVADGHAVRGTTRDPARVDDIAAAGAEPYVGDPDRVVTLMDAFAGVTVVCHLLGTASGGAAAQLHGTRLAMLLEKLVDTPVRGFAYEPLAAAGVAARKAGVGEVRHAHTTWNIPLALIEADPGRHAAWQTAARGAVAALLDGEAGSGGR
jgi:uncharacterized protein YbjT (DUF2867 family)